MSEDRFPGNWVRVMADWDADGVWNQRGASCPVDWLPISDGLIAMIRAWQLWFEQSDCEWADPPSSFDWTNFGLVGMAIARTMKWELPDEWRVFFYSDEVLSPEHYVWDSVLRPMSDDEKPDWLKREKGEKLGPGSSPG